MLTSTINALHKSVRGVQNRRVEDFDSESDFLQTHLVRVDVEMQIIGDGSADLDIDLSNRVRRHSSGQVLVTL